MQWYFVVLKNYAVFNGRSRRKEYWMFFLFNIIIGLLLGFILGFIDAFLFGYNAYSSTVTTLYSIFILIPSIAVAVRRVHDTGHSGWWVLVPIVGLVFLCFDSQPETNRFGKNPKLDLI
ncbi:DUF805 domain-containing protein [Vibrio lentus]|uniref:DUF805 domain-containing protein n=1 Tax=Vibrio lentus TaxID=136468 RepID=UPI000C83DCB6|nr:DUF805 domain-containing protein [Vibrio lentus]PMI41064.1 cytochrome [Vibrio lentus]PMJ52813.1 cytochrome [Vibrio lentus]